MQANPVETYRSLTVIIDTNNESNSSEDVMLTTPSRKRSKKQGKGEKPKKQKTPDVSLLPLP